MTDDVYHIGDYVRLWVHGPCSCWLTMPAGNTLILIGIRGHQGDYFVHFIASIVGFYQLDVPGSEPVCFEVKP